MEVTREVHATAALNPGKDLDIHLAASPMGFRACPATAEER